MRPFDTIVMVDWSGAPDTKARPRADAIWAGIVRHGEALEPRYLRSPKAAEDWLLELIERERAASRRLLIGFDFPFGYPAGIGKRICGSSDPRALWGWFSHAFATLPPNEGRFHIAGRLNGSFPGEGPFWFNGLKADIPGLPRRKPVPFPDVPPCRAVEKRTPGTFVCWQMGGSGAVGSQAMTGMACLGRLCRELGADAAVWPFDPSDALVLLVEVWPSLVDVAVRKRLAGDSDLPRGANGPITDAAQVIVLAEAVWNAQQSGALEAMLAAPPDSVRQEEGWILGVGGDVELSEFAGSPAADGAMLFPPALKDDCFALPPGVVWTPVEDALSRLRDGMRTVTGRETVPTASADGRILAADARASRANPPGANSAVDGYGFAHAATGPGPQTLPVLAGRAAAGAPFAGAVASGSAIRILTGALLPEGVDTVVLDEDTRIDGGRVAFNGPVKAGANTRKKGEDVLAGALALKAGHVLRPPDLALLSAVGLDRIAVHARLRVGVLSTGSELAEPGSTRDPGATFDANRPMLLAMARRWGHEPVDLGRVGDDRDALADGLGAPGVDAILTSGGASAGDEDHVSALLRAEGRLHSWRIALKPGRPLALGLWRGRPVFGLPGNPVAAFVCALIFARPALSALAGGPWTEPTSFMLPAAFTKRKKPGRREFLRARIGPDGVEVFRSEGSGRISGLSWADGLVDLPEEAAEITPGTTVRFLPYGGFGLG